MTVFIEKRNKLKRRAVMAEAVPDHKYLFLKQCFVIVLHSTLGLMEFFSKVIRVFVDVIFWE